MVMALKSWTPQLIQDSGGDKIVVSNRPEQNIKSRNTWKLPSKLLKQTSPCLVCKGAKS